MSVVVVFYNGQLTAKASCYSPLSKQMHYVFFSRNKSLHWFLSMLVFCSGSAMNVAYGPAELKGFLQDAARVSEVYRVLKVCP